MDIRHFQIEPYSFRKMLTNSHHRILKISITHFQIRSYSYQYNYEDGQLQIIVTKLLFKISNTHFQIRTQLFLKRLTKKVSLHYQLVQQR